MGLTPPPRVEKREEGEEGDESKEPQPGRGDHPHFSTSFLKRLLFLIYNKF
jgi:hypothetical protein